jgi:hypothetical protein
MSALQLMPQVGLSHRTAWLLTQKLRRSVVDPDRSPLTGLGSVDIHRSARAEPTRWIIAVKLSSVLS